MIRETPGPALEKYRDRNGPYASNPEDGWNGRFFIPRGSRRFCLMVSNGMGWEHVSVSIVGANRTPTWEEMCWVKRTFWSDEECVVQYHPKKSDYVNWHPACLHLWMPTDAFMPMPLPVQVGPSS